jgi:hypothetical protein
MLKGSIEKNSNKRNAQDLRLSLFKARQCRAFILPILPILLNKTCLSSTPSRPGSLIHGVW